MFDWSWIDDLDADSAADALAEVRQEVLAAEAKRFVLAAHWADLHPALDGPDLDGVPAPLPGVRRMVPIRGGSTGNVEGTPEVDEYAAAELAALLGRSTVGGQQLVADAVAVRHRHPSLWSAVRAGQAPVWIAGQVARRCIRAGLGAAQAEWVDAQTTPYITTLPPGRFLELVEAKIIAADPDAAEERARAKALARFVHVGHSDEHGLRTLVARAHAGEVTYLVAVLDRIAVILAERGDHRPLEVLRTEALRILANPAHALALLTEATLHTDPTTEPATADHADHAGPAEDRDNPTGIPGIPGGPVGGLGREALFPHGDAGWRCDSTGRALPGAFPDLADVPLLDPTELADLPEYQQLTAHTAHTAHTGPTALTGPTGAAGAAGATGAVGDARNDAGEEHTDRALLTALLEALGSFDASRWDPVTVLHVHLSETAVRSRQGLVRIEGIGPALLSEVRDWISHPFHPDQIRHQVTLRPVLDAAAVVPVDRYEHTPAMDELAICGTPYEVFPFGTLAARAADSDHPKPYVKDGPPGQTSLDQLAKLSRFHHRLKTNGNWILRHPEPGLYWWRTPHGHWFLVDPDGTHWHGRDPDLDNQHLHQQHAA